MHVQSCADAVVLGWDASLSLERERENYAERGNSLHTLWK